MKTIILTLGMLGITACSSSSVKEPDLSHIGEEEVIQTYGKDDSLKGAQPFRVDGGNIVSTGFVSFSADGNRAEAGIKMAQMNARADMARAIENKIENFAQLAEEGVSIDNAQLRSITSEISKLTANDIRPRNVYYEKVRVISDAGTPRTEYRIWAEAIVSESAFKQHIARALRGETRKPTFSKAFQEAVDQNWKKVVEAKPEEPIAAQKAENKDDNLRKEEPKESIKAPETELPKEAKAPKQPKVEEAIEPEAEAKAEEPAVEEEVAEVAKPGKREPATEIIDTIAKQLSRK